MMHTPDASTLPTLEGERIRLRSVADCDVPALFAVFGDPAVTRYWAAPPLRDEAAAAQLLAEIRARVRERTSLQWGIARRDDDELLGACSLYRPDFDNRRSEIGFALGRAHWGHGYASEAIRLAIAYAFDVLHFERLEADVDPRNAASLRALERLGFRREGYLRERYRVNGEVQDSLLLGLLRSEWQGAGEQPSHRHVRAPTESRRLLRHFLAALAYRTQKALRGAPPHFAEFRADTNVRTPHELLWHMTGVIGYARTMLHGGEFAPPRLPTFADEVARFHDTLATLAADLADPSLEARISDEQFLQGPLSDAMTHAGQLAMLRRLAGAPVASENFIFATIDSANVGAEQPDPVAPDPWWRPDRPPPSPGPGNRYEQDA